jgi:hypothetical protein
VVIRHPGAEPIRLSRIERGEDFAVEPVPAGREPQSDIFLARTDGILENTFASNVTSARDYNFPADHVETVIRTFDGLVAEVQSAGRDGRNYVAFEFSVDASNLPPAADEEGDRSGKSAEDIRAEADKYNGIVSGWVYTLPDYRYQLLTRSLEDLTRPAE